MSAKNDQVFQLSLTEIAFMLTFLLMLVLGLMLVGLQNKNRDLLDQLQSESTLEQQHSAMTSARDFMRQTLETIGFKDPDEVISQLVKESHAHAESERLKVLLNEKEQQLTAMVELEKVLAQMSQKTEATAAQIQTSLVVMSKLGERLGPESSAGDRSAELDRLISATELVAGQAPKDDELTIVEKATAVVADAQAYQEIKSNKLNPVELKRENANLRGQMVYLQNRLDARGGMDFPPCWADEVTGKTQLLFSLVLRDETLLVSPAWPASREQDAAVLPNIKQILSKPEVGYPEFISSVRQIFALSKQQNCRHYVLIDNTITDAVQSDRKRLMIEGSFYKIEKRR
ncbi:MULTISPECIES: hypothetical protein [Pseudomonadaceae]|uniref:hypothetical protein n=1 Tax=Pseudomonadaceae TaxID=135621 RepID=UPI00103F8D83|nr:MULTISPECIES: hypothetical protein [Pseudomonadaceae]MCQ4260975.1 hypothetical protein [Stutzerimonas stutzeri]TCD19187.1 hypothetical protein E0D86_19455 [Pseudomonas sp. IC_126]